MPQSALTDLVMRSRLLHSRASGTIGCSGGCAPACGAAITKNRKIFNGILSPRQEFVQKQMEMMDAVLALHREAALVVAVRPQPALHVLADPDVFLLDLVAELDGLCCHCTSSVKREPLGDGQRLVRTHRHDDVAAEIVRIDVEHEVDRKSTRLNSSHLVISYAVFCLKKK